MFNSWRAILRPLVSAWLNGLLWLREQRQVILGKVALDAEAMTRTRRLTRRILRYLPTEFPPSYVGDAPRLVRVRFMRTQLSHSTAQAQAEREPLGRIVFDNVLEGADAVEEAGEIRELVIDCVRKIELALPKREMVTPAAHGARAGLAALTRACVKSAAATGDHLPFKLGALAPLLEQCGLCIRGKTNVLTAALRGSFATLAITATSWVAKVVGTAVGFFFGGPSGAMAGGALCSFLAAKATRWLFHAFYAWCAQRAANRLNDFSLKSLRALRREKLRILLAIRTLRKQIENEWGAEWQRIWHRTNGRLTELFAGDERVKEELLGLLISELAAIRAWIHSGWAYRGFVRRLPLTQRWLLRTSPATRRRLHSHFTHTRRAIDTLLKDLVRTARAQDQLRRLLLWLEDERVCSPIIRDTLERHLRARIAHRHQALALSDEVAERLQVSGTGLRKRFHEPVDQWLTQWEAKRERRAAGLNQLATRVKEAVDKAGMDLVFSSVQR